MEKKKYNSKMYNDKFREKHAEKIATKTVCTGCGRTFTYYTKSKHMKTKKHMQAIIPKEKEDETHFWKFYNHFFKPQVVPEVVPEVVETPIIINNL
jgi:hypothetical protein